MRAGRILRRIVMDRIIAEVPGLSGRVFDKAVVGTAYPYATLGPSYWSDDSADCIEGRTMTLQIDIWHSAANKGVLEDLTDDVAACLKDFADEDVLTMHPISIALVRVLNDPSGDLHGVVQVEVGIEGG